ncbi:MAG: LysE family transporter [Chloroflexota bacterium]|nr:LysE family transporter [Chloroflexota bacterium]
MDLGFLLRGLIIGFSIAAPVGPIGVLCIRRTITEGRAAGFATGLGVATADGTYGFIAGFGLTFISDLLISQQFWIRLIGGGFICYLGIKTLLSEPAQQAAKVTGQGLAGAYISTFFLTLTNPITILSFAAVMAGLGAGSTSGDYLSATLLVVGVFLGSTLWWFILSGGVSLFRQKFNFYTLRWVNRISGVIIITFGLLALLTLVK